MSTWGECTKYAKFSLGAHCNFLSYSLDHELLFARGQQEIVNKKIKYFSDSVDLPPSWVHEVNAQNMLRFPWERIGGTIGCQWTLDCTWKRCYWTVCHRTKLYDDSHSVGHLLFQTGIDSEKKRKKVILNLNTKYVIKNNEDIQKV